MRKRRPVLGIVSGLVFGVFLAADLALFGLVTLDSVLLPIVAVLGLALGIFLGFRRRDGGRRADKVPPEAAAQAVAGDAPAAVTTEAAPPPPPPADGD